MYISNSLLFSYVVNILTHVTMLYLLTAILTPPTPDLAGNGRWINIYHMNLKDYGPTKLPRLDEQRQGNAKTGMEDTQNEYFSIFWDEDLLGNWTIFSKN